MSPLSYGQNSEKQTYSDQFIKDCIIEVFQDQADDLVFDSNSIRYSFMSNFMKDQVVIEYHPEYNGKGFESTNDLGVFKKYNPSLDIDVSYDVHTFNPLKYIHSINTNTLKKLIYRIGTTDYIMIIHPSK